MEFYCGIFVGWSRPRVELERLVQQVVARDAPRLVDAISVVRNKSRGDTTASRAALWLNSPYLIEIDPAADSCSLLDCIGLVTTLVRRLKSAKIDAVPACDYEDQLPTDVVWSE